MGNVHMEATQINYRGGSVKKSVEEAIKDAIELTPEQKTNINKIPAIEAAVATKAAQSIIATEFDSEAGIYSIGDLVMHEGKLYEFTTAHETAGDWNSEEVTEKTVADEVDTLKSGLTNYENQNNLNLEVPDRKNVLPNGVKSGSYAGVEWTLNDDGSITFNGTATQQIFNKMYFSTDLDLPVGEYIYNGGSGSITFQLANKAESQAYYTYTGGSGYIEVTQAMVGDMIARLIINNGTVLNNVTIYPMIRPKSIESGAYAPYIPSVESRIEAVESGLLNVKEAIDPTSGEVYSGDIDILIDTCNKLVGNNNKMPTTGNYNLHVFKTADFGSGDCIVTQYAVGIQGGTLGKAYIRTLYNNWSSWYEITTTVVTQ